MKQKILDYLKEQPNCDISSLYAALPVEASRFVGTETTAIQATVADIRESMEANGDKLQTNLMKMLEELIEEKKIVETAPNRFKIA
jgi:chromosome condensin MukBEF complex kleisin-like MukF subunit